MSPLPQDLNGITAGAARALKEIARQHGYPSAEAYLDDLDVRDHHPPEEPEGVDERGAPVHARQELVLVGVLPRHDQGARHHHDQRYGDRSVGEMQGIQLARKEQPEHRENHDLDGRVETYPRSARGGGVGGGHRCFTRSSGGDRNGIGDPEQSCGR